MADQQQSVFQAVIGIIDKATKPLQAIAGKLLGLGGAAEKAGKKTESLHHASMWSALSAHVTLLRGHFASLGASIGEVRGSLVEFLPALGALGAGGSLVGLFELTRGVAEAKAEATAAAAKLGMTADQLQLLNAAATLTDISVESMQRGLGKLNIVIAASAGGRNKDAAGLFRHLGINVRDASGHLRTAADMMPQLADAIARTTDPAMQSRMAMAMFGKTGLDMLPMLKKGSAGMEEMADAAKKLGYFAGPEETKNMLELNDSFKMLDMATKGFTDEMGAKMAGVFSPVVDAVTEWVAANRDWIATGITDKVRDLGEWVKALLPHIKPTIQAFGDWVTRLHESAGPLGSVKAAVGALLLVMGAPFAAAIIEVITGIGRFGMAIKSMTLIMASNPFGAIILAVVAVAAAAYMLYEHWDWVKAQFDKLFSWFSQQSGWVQALLTIIAPIIVIPMQIIAHWSELTTFFSDMWAGIHDTFSGGWKGVSYYVDKISGAISWISEHAPKFLGGGGGESMYAAHARVGDGEAGFSAGMGADGFNAPLPPPGMPAPSAPVSGGGGTTRVEGAVETRIVIEGLPPGSKTSSTSSGIASAPTLDVGYGSAMGMGMAY